MPQAHPRRASLPLPSSTESTCVKTRPARFTRTENWSAATAPCLYLPVWVVERVCVREPLKMHERLQDKTRQDSGSQTAPILTWRKVPASEVAPEATSDAAAANPSEGHAWGLGGGNGD